MLDKMDNAKYFGVFARRKIKQATMFEVSYKALEYLEKKFRHWKD